MEEEDSLRGVVGPWVICRGEMAGGMKEERGWWGGEDGRLAEERWEEAEGGLCHTGGGGLSAQGSGEHSIGKRRRVGISRGSSTREVEEGRARGSEEEIRGGRGKEGEGRRGEGGEGNEGASEGIAIGRQTRKVVGDKSEDGKEERKATVIVGLNMTLNPYTGWGNLAYALFFGFLDAPSSPISPIMLSPLPAASLHPPAPHHGRLVHVYASQERQRSIILSSKTSRSRAPVLHVVDHETYDSTEARDRPSPSPLRALCLGLGADATS